TPPVSPSATPSSAPPTTPPPTRPTTPPAIQPTTPPPNRPLPVVQISMSKPGAHVGENITFKVTTKGSPALTLAKWNYGSGVNTNGVQVPHSGAAPQTYQVSVTVTFPDGRKATTSVSVTITPVPVVAEWLTVVVTGNGMVTSVPAGISC